MGYNYTPDFVESLAPGEVFVFGSNILGYHNGGAARKAKRDFGAVWGQPEGLQGQSYAIPVDSGKGAMDIAQIKSSIERFITFAKSHSEFVFLVTRIGCGIAGFREEEMAPLFKEAIGIKNIKLPRSFVEILTIGSRDYDLERFVRAQDDGGTYTTAIQEVKRGVKQGHWMWFVFPQIKGLGHSITSEYYGISGKEEAAAYLSHSVLGGRLREITQAVLNTPAKSMDELFGFPDVLKLRSCMTLFDLIAPNDIFSRVLQKYYEGKRCEKTILRVSIREGKMKNRSKLSRLTLTPDYRILLPDYGDVEVEMEPIIKAVYILFLQHQEGIAFKELPDHRQELKEIYSQIKGKPLTEREKASIEDLTNPYSNSINEKCSRIRAAFLKVVSEPLVDSYCIKGESGGRKRILLPAHLLS